MTQQYHITWFRAGQQQPLRNVRLHAPSVIQILSGSKQLYWQATAMALSSSQLLLCEASTSLTFENQPHKGRFLSRMFSFHVPPSDALLALSHTQAEQGDLPVPWLPVDSALEVTLNALAMFEGVSMTAATQTHWVMGFYQQLAERGKLHALFPEADLPFSQQIGRYLSHSPEEEHPLEQVAAQFAMSRATLIRKLKAEGRQYREVLAEVRLNHALYLMQQGQTNVAMLAQSCGYQSEGRFSQRFKHQFGLTPSGYIKTLSN